MLKWILATASALIANIAIACTCNPPPMSDPARNEYFSQLFRSAEVVVHAKIKKVDPQGNVTVEVIELFKGPKSLNTIRAMQGASASCGIALRVGEEAIYVSNGGYVSLCGTFTPDPSVIKALRKIRKREQK